MAPLDPLWLRYLQTRALPDRNALVVANLPLATSLVTQAVKRRGLDPAFQRGDLDSFAAEGLLQAIERFDVRFAWTAYACRRIRGAVKDGMRSSGRDRRRAQRPAERERRTFTLNAADLDQHAATPDPTDAAELHEVAGLVERLPAGDRIVIEMRYWRGMTLEAIAGELGRSKGAVHAAERRALARLRALADQ